MAMLVKFVALCSLAAVAASAGSAERRGYSLKCKQVESAVKDLAKAIATDLAADEDGNYYRRLIGGFVRLNFHMCTGGRCKGCINVADPNNVHLDQYISVLEPLYKRHNEFSRGDFWALAGITALQESEKLTNAKYGRNYTFMQQGLAFRYGRLDCSPDTPFTDERHEFPDATRGIEDTLDFFARNFNFSDEDVVVVLGAHKLGGFRNPHTHNIARQWVSPADTLTNEYYTNLLNDSNEFSQAEFFPCSNCSSTYVYQNGYGKRLMLNVDMSLRKNLTFANGYGGKATCTVQSCPDSDTIEAVHEYAESDEAWEIDFADVFTRMIETGYAYGELKSCTPEDEKKVKGASKEKHA